MFKELIRIYKPASPAVLRAEQLEDAQRERLAWAMAREQAAAMEQMYNERIARLYSEVNHVEINRIPKPADWPSPKLA